MTKFKKMIALALTFGVAISAFAGCSGSSGSGDSEVVIYTNADDEAIEAMKSTLDENGYEGKYLMQSFGTSELGGKTSCRG